MLRMSTFSGACPLTPHCLDLIVPSGWSLDPEPESDSMDTNDQSSTPTLSAPLCGHAVKPRWRRGSSKPCSLLCFSRIALFLLRSPPMCTYTCVCKWLTPQAPPRCVHPHVNRYSKTAQHLAVTRIHHHKGYE